MSIKKSESIRIPEGTIHRTIGLLRGALNRLDAPMDEVTIERIGVTVHRAMSMHQRSFHTPEHIFDLADPEDAHRTLAAIFHDIVYFQVDEGFLDSIEKLLKPYVIITREVRIREKIDSDDRAFFGTAAVFGFSPGQLLSPFAGLNEFLSALVMNIFLEGIVRDADLLVATAAIEMTIPFRGPDSEGKRPPELLEHRLRMTNTQFRMNLSDDRIHAAVIAAVGFANRDVRNFSEEDPGGFLDNTWKLLPESNPELRVHGLYSIGSYSTALMKMEGFLSSLKPENVFQTYNGYPEKAEYESLLQRVSINLSTALEYLGIKMVSAALLQALAELSGGDAPIAFFMGDMDPKDEWSRLSFHLPSDFPHFQRLGSEDTSMSRLLEQGRANASRFDLQNSPLSLFVYRCLRADEQDICIQASREYIKGQRTAASCLDTPPPALVAAIARAASVMAFTRRTALEKIAEKYSMVIQGSGPTNSKKRQGP